jgi:hypothetical protein
VAIVTTITNQSNEQKRRKDTITSSRMDLSI